MLRGGCSSARPSEDSFTTVDGTPRRIAVVATWRQSSKTDQQMAFRRTWSSRTSARIRSGAGRAASLAHAVRCSGCSDRRPERPGSRRPQRRDHAQERGPRRRPGRWRRRRTGPHRAARALPCGAHRVPAPGSGVHHLHLATHPRARPLDRVPRPGVHRLGFFEEREHVLGPRAAHRATSWWSASPSMPPRRIVINRGPRTSGRAGRPGRRCGRRPGEPAATAAASPVGREP